jgi:hypothetical protein
VLEFAFQLESLLYTYIADDMITQFRTAQRWILRERNYRVGGIPCDHCKKFQLGVQFFLMCLLLFSTCFGQLCANHQEKILYLCDTWYSSLYMDDCMVCRTGKKNPCHPTIRRYTVRDTDSAFQKQQIHKQANK